MDWTAASAIAEVVGAIAVVASLIYIATQIRQNSDLLRQNTEIARSTIIHETSAMYVGMHAQIAQNEELADIYRRGMDNESLDETEQVRYIALIQMELTALEDTEFHYTSGLYFVEDDDEDLVDYVAPNMIRLMRPAFVKEFWYKQGVHTYTPSFITRIEKIMKDEWGGAT